MVRLLRVADHIEFEGNEPADVLVRKGVGMPLHGQKSFCGIGKRFMTQTLMNNEERLNELYSAKSSGVKQCRVQMGRR